MRALLFARESPRAELDREGRILALRTEALGRALEQLSPRKRKIVELRYGLAGSEPMMLEAVGREVGLTRERVRQLEAEALTQLSAMPDIDGIRDAA